MRSFIRRGTGLRNERKRGKETQRQRDKRETGKFLSVPGEQ